MKCKQCGFELGESAQCCSACRSPRGKRLSNSFAVPRDPACQRKVAEATIRYTLGTLAIVCLLGLFFFAGSDDKGKQHNDSSLTASTEQTRIPTLIPLRSHFLRCISLLPTIADKAARSSARNDSC